MLEQQRGHRGVSAPYGNTARNVRARVGATAASLPLASPTRPMCPLQLACLYGHAECVDALLRHGADASAINKVSSNDRAERGCIQHARARCGASCGLSTNCGPLPRCTLDTNRSASAGTKRACAPWHARAHCGASWGL